VQLYLSDAYNKHKVYERFKKIKFGKNVRILHFPRWGSEPFLIEIGNNVTITRGVCFVNHDGSVALFRREYPGLNVYGRIKIGDNVFIGINSIIMPGVTVGSNVVIGAGSIVNRDVPDNVVIAGVPAKVIKTLPEYLKKSLNSGIIVPSNLNKKERKRFIIAAILKNQNNKI